MKEGDDAPNFELKDQDGNAVTLDSFRGSKNVVLCFYPKNRIFGCPSKKVFKMAESVIASYDDIRATGSELFAISTDTVDSQKKFVKEYSVPYSHLSNSSKDVCKRYAGLNIAGMAKRATFIIDREGKIRKILSGMDAESHGLQIVTALKQI